MLTAAASAVSRKRIERMYRQGEIPAVKRSGECDNHVHSQFSFSPYSPCKIAWKAYESGLDTCGIVDHESVAGCRNLPRRAGYSG